MTFNSSKTKTLSPFAALITSPNFIFKIEYPLIIILDLYLIIWKMKVIEKWRRKVELHSNKKKKELKKKMEGKEGRKETLKKQEGKEAESFYFVYTLW